LFADINIRTLQVRIALVRAVNGKLRGHHDAVSGNTQLN